METNKNIYDNAGDKVQEEILCSKSSQKLFLEVYKTEL